ncbi:hypothetical protein [Aureivirga sp. CE67]|uniref:hypothetical protein n=1 Tax=Aureivirga sp. CE67 TaxID=1788983 RepID=UPI0018CB365E|nr:hypothetical protein [Aureivirga sp. CE67]
MQQRFIENKRKSTGDRIESKNIAIPKIRAEFFVRLFSFLGFEPDVTEEGYAFYIQDSETGLNFSAELTGFGPGYFSKENPEEVLKNIKEFDQLVFSEDLDLKETSFSYEHDFGTTILAYKNNEILETDIPD